MMCNAHCLSFCVRKKREKKEEEKLLLVVAASLFSLLDLLVLSSENKKRRRRRKARSKFWRRRRGSTWFHDSKREEVRVSWFLVSLTYALLLLVVWDSSSPGFLTSTLFLVPCLSGNFCRKIIFCAQEIKSFSVCLNPGLGCLCFLLLLFSLALFSSPLLIWQSMSCVQDTLLHKSCHLWYLTLRVKGISIFGSFDDSFHLFLHCSSSCQRRVLSCFILCSFSSSLLTSFLEESSLFDLCLWQNCELCSRWLCSQ